MVVQKKVISQDEYRAIADLPENRDKILELIEGEIVEKVPSFTPSRIGYNVGFHVKLYLRDNPIGYVTGEAGGYVMSDLDTFNPDVGYISKARLPEEPEHEAPAPPDFAVEVKSPTDSKREMRRKAEKYIAYGTRLVWLVFPEEKLVEVYLSNEDVKTFGINDILDGADVLPGFTLPVSAIFEG